MDLKACLMLKHYKEIIEKHLFDEYDILGFLIFIRSYINKGKYKYISEFTDLVAHRERDRGIVMDDIESAIKNNYVCEQGTNTIKEYNGIKNEDWDSEWKELAEEFDIALTDRLIKEITLCIFSLAQKTEYCNKNGYEGKIEIHLFKSKSIALLTTEGHRDSLFICFAKYDGIKVNDKYSLKPMSDIVYTIRENGELKLKVENETIAEI
jgi:hypothetical protein